MADSGLEVSDLISRRPLWKRWAVVTSIVLIGVIAGLGYYQFVGRTKTAAAPTTQEVKVTLGSLSTTLAASGTAAAEQSIPLTFSAGGIVTDVLVHLGDAVTKSQPLARVDSRDAQRKLASAQASLVQAQLKLNQLLNPTASDRASSQQSLVSARTQLENAQATYASLGQPSASDLTAAQSALASAKAGVESAQNSVDNSRASLQQAQNNYCALSQETTLGICTPDTLPITPEFVAKLQASISRGQTVPTQNLFSAVTSLIPANSSYVNALSSRDTAGFSVLSAQAKLDALTQPTPEMIRVALAAVQNAQASYDATVAKAADLTNPGPVDVGLQQQAVQSAQVALDQAKDALDDCTLTAPFPGRVGTVSAIIGQRIGGGTTAVVLANPDAIRLDLTISEADLVNVKAGMLGLARFDSLPQNAYVVRVMGVSAVPTVTQGVVTYPVQAAILRGTALNDIRDQLPQLATALTSGAAGAQFSALLGGGAGRPGAGAGAGAGAGGTGPRTPGAGAGTGTPQGTADATATGTRTPRATGTASATGTVTGTPSGTATGTGTPTGTRGPGWAAAGGVGIQALLNPPLPTAGMNASVRLLVRVVENQLLVPTGAVRRQENQFFVYGPGTAGGAPVQKRVVTAGTDGTNTAIASGVAEGDVVLLGAIGTATPTATRPAGGPPGGGGGVGGGIR